MGCRYSLCSAPSLRSRPRNSHHHPAHPLQDQNTANQDRIDRGNTNLDYQRTQLLNKFINMETALAQMNSTLNSVKQLTNSLFGNSNSNSNN